MTCFLLSSFELRAEEISDNQLKQFGEMSPDEQEAALKKVTPAQIEQFQKLSEAQQQLLANKLGMDVDKLKGMAASAGTTNGDATNVAPPPPVPPAPRATPSPDLNAPVENVANSQKSDRAKLRETQEAQGSSKALKPFGYSLFAGTPTTFAPTNDIPVPVNYVIGPGDSIVVQLYGKENASYDLKVDREGFIRFPNLGPVNAAGQKFEDFKSNLANTISEKIIGAKAFITMGTLRSIRIFVMGEAYRPGSYTVSSLSTITNALLASGGVTPIGSLRKIQLKRHGEMVTTIDLYDLLLNGNTSADERLLPGDVIFVPTIGKTVGIGGEVRRPAIYEIKDESRFDQLIELSGGVLPTAYPEGSRVERIDRAGNRTMVDINLAKGGKAVTPHDGDVLTVASVLEKMENVVLLSGHVNRPGGYQWHAGLRVSDLVKSVSSLLPEPDLQYALIKREIMPTREITVEAVNLNAALASPHSAADVPLRNRDELMVFGKYAKSRMDGIASLSRQLRAQTAFNQPSQTVSVTGNVRFPGEYPRTAGMRLSHLVSVADLDAQTDMNYALVRRELQPSRDIELIPVTLNSTQESQADLLLAPQDNLLVFSMSKDDRSVAIKTINEQLGRQSLPGDPTRVVSISGDVKFPGTYPLTPFMHVRDLVQAAGGFRESAYGVDAEVSRAIINAQQENTFSRIKVSFGANDKSLVDESLLLISRDQLYIKRVPNWNAEEFAEIFGEVRFPGKYPIYRGDTLRDLVQRAGGLTDHADANAAVFQREDLRKREQDQLERMREQLQRDIATLQIDVSKQKAAGLETQAVGQNLLSQVTAAKASGRLSINLQSIIDGHEDTPVKIRNGDRLVVPRPAQEVSVVGEVQYPSSHLYQNGKSISNYIDLAGGLTNRSDKSRAYVIKANGTIVPAGKFGMLPWNNESLRGGDTIVVPYDVFEVSPLTYWTTLSQILFNISTTAAALKTVGVYN